MVGIAHSLHTIQPEKSTAGNQKHLGFIGVFAVGVPVVGLEPTRQKTLIFG
jgi:hypothetical protein